MKKLIAGNWKMNGGLQANRALLQSLLRGLPDDASRCDILVCPPAAYLAQAQELLQDQSAICLGAQDVSDEPEGARTGEVSAHMLTDFDVVYCIVGHSERRRFHGESDAQVAEKTAQLLACNIVPVICVGESLQEREQALAQDVVRRQLLAVIERNRADLKQLVVAYEPVWAIGTGRTATPAQAQEIHAFLRQLLRDELPQQADAVRILYGGSMNAGNACLLLEQPDINGGLIGGAALKAEDFLAIVQAAVS